MKVLFVVCAFVFMMGAQTGCAGENSPTTVTTPPDSPPKPMPPPDNEPPQKEPIPPPPDKAFDVSDFPNRPGTIYGRWMDDYSEFDKGLAIVTEFYFNRKNQIGIRRFCAGSGLAAHREVTVLISGRVKNNRIYFNESAEAVHHDCILQVPIGSWPYHIRKNKLEVEWQKKQWRVYSRI